MEKQMKILERKIKNRERNTTIKIVLLSCLCALLLVAICIVGAVWYSSYKKAMPMSNTSVEDKVNALEENSSNFNNKNKKDKKQQVKKVLNDIKDEYIAIFNKKYPSFELSFLIKDLDQGTSVVYNPKQMNSASIIKLFIMETVYKEAQNGNYELSDEKLDALEIMIAQSSNNAANLFIDDFGGIDDTRKVTDENLINKTIQASGYKSTQINRKMYDSTPPGGPTGYDNFTDVEDVARLLEGIYNKTLFKEPYNTNAINFLKSQQRQHKIPQKILKKYPNVVVANKTGELSNVENDCAIIMGEDYNLILVIMVNNIDQTQQGINARVQNTISEFGLMLVEKYENS